MDILDKYRKWSELLCTLYQHKGLNAIPTWIHVTEEGRGYVAESFVLGFDDDKFSLEFYYEEHDGVYQYTFHRYEKNSGQRYQIIPLGNDVDKIDFKPYVNEINERFAK